MWVCKKANWDSSHSDLSKYLVEKIRQQVDWDETISNRHKTTNGYVLIQEMVLMIDLVKRKVKFKRRLESLIDEAKSSLIPSSVVNDYILQRHFGDIVTFVKTLQKSDLDKLDKLSYKLEIFKSRLEKNYLSSIESDLRSIDFDSTHFLKYSTIIDKLIDCLIPYLLFVGYSITSISDITYSFIDKPHGKKSFVRLLTRFRGVSFPEKRRIQN